MLEADGYDPNLPLHSGPTPGPTSLWGFTSSGKARAIAREDPSPTGQCLVGGTATEANPD
jgi:hypothetical protein